VLAGEEYGSGSSRDWAAKGPMLLVFDNIISLPFLCWLPEICNIYLTKLMPSGGESGDRQEFREDPPQQSSGNGGDTLCFKPDEDADSLGLTGHERFTIRLPSNVNEIQPGQDVEVVTDSGKSFTCKLRIDTLVSSPVTLNW